MTATVAIQTNISLKNYTTFQVGGYASFLVEVKTFDEMQDAIQYASDENLPFHILGKGSNTLCADEGYKGLIIINKIDFMENIENSGLFHVGAGYSFSLLGTQTARNGWSGLEFASGIPGSVGGAVFMNAGANGKETCESLHSVLFMTEKREIIEYPAETLAFSYRTSPFQKLKGAILSATFKLTPLATARKDQINIIKYRTDTQPYSEKSAGCIFQNPPKYHAGKLIELSGLKGYSIGGAEVSIKHANFIINSKNATADNILCLIDHVKKEVYKKTGVELKSEVRILSNETL